jgi:hypothetical protein
MIGQRFGRLTVVANAGTPRGSTQRRRAWFCRCDCGTELILPQTNLKTGNTKSCGCYNVEQCEQRVGELGSNYRHGHQLNRRPSPTMRSYDAMHGRCERPSVNGYARYGGRGIKVCERWSGPNGFLNFLADMGERPKGHTIDRFPNNKGNYEPGNCRWATSSQQNRNKPRHTPAKM